MSKGRGLYFFSFFLALKVEEITIYSRKIETSIQLLVASDANRLSKVLTAQNFHDCFVNILYFLVYIHNKYYTLNAKKCFLNSPRRCNTHSFLTSTLHGEEWLVSQLQPLYPLGRCYVIHCVGTFWVP